MSEGEREPSMAQIFDSIHRFYNMTAQLYAQLTTMRNIGRQYANNRLRRQMLMEIHARTVGLCARFDERTEHRHQELLASIDSLRRRTEEVKTRLGEMGAVRPNREHRSEGSSFSQDHGNRTIHESWRPVHTNREHRSEDRSSFSVDHGEGAIRETRRPVHTNREHRSEDGSSFSVDHGEGAIRETRGYTSSELASCELEQIREPSSSDRTLRYIEGAVRPNREHRSEGSSLSQDRGKRTIRESWEYSSSELDSRELDQIRELPSSERTGCYIKGTEPGHRRYCSSGFPLHPVQTPRTFKVLGRHSDRSHLDTAKCLRGNKRTSLCQDFKSIGIQTDGPLLCDKCGNSLCGEIQPHLSHVGSASEHELNLSFGSIASAMFAKKGAEATSIQRSSTDTASPVIMRRAGVKDSSSYTKRGHFEPHDSSRGVSLLSTYDDGSINEKSRGVIREYAKRHSLPDSSGLSLQRKSKDLDFSQSSEYSFLDSRSKVESNFRSDDHVVKSSEKAEYRRHSHLLASEDSIYRKMSKSIEKKTDVKDSEAALSSPQSAGSPELFETESCALKEQRILPSGLFGATIEESSKDNSDNESSEHVASSSSMQAGDYDPTPLTASHAFQKLAGEVPSRSPAGALRFPQSDSESSDDAERQLTAAISAVNVKDSSVHEEFKEMHSRSMKEKTASSDMDSSFRRASLQAEQSIRHQTKSASSDSPSKLRSTNPAVRFKGRMSDSAMKALGWIEDSSSVLPVVKKDEKDEDSDEFDFFN